MRLLIVTQKVDQNDPVLGFFVRWIEEFAKHAEFVYVICLGKGEYNLPENVEVYSLGKEEGKSKVTYLYRFYKYIFTLDYDNVFVHMNQVYIILGGLFWRVLRKKIGLWYAHGSVSLSLWIATILTHNIFTSTKSGFRLKSSKVHVVGQGIDTDLFNLKEGNLNDKFEIISVGRISPVKDYETLIDAVEILSDQNLHVTIVGGVGLPKQEKYFSGLKKIVEEKNLTGKIHFVGSMPNNEIVRNLQDSDLFVNTSHTGSLDKAILEAMSVGLPILTCNEAIYGVLGDLKDSLTFPKKDSTLLSERIKFFMNIDTKEKNELGITLRDIVLLNHSIKGFTDKIIKQYVF